MASIYGTNQSERLDGTTTIDTIYGYGGNDQIYGLILQPGFRC